jgi:hypothetical protein
MHCHGIEPHIANRSAAPRRGCGPLRARRMPQRAVAVWLCNAKKRMREPEYRDGERSMTGDQKALDALLVRWHRWSADPLTSGDTAMCDFDRVVGELWPYLAAALIVEARNLACGAAVWRNPRSGRRTLRDARCALLKALSVEQHRWFGAEVVKLSARGNRVGDSNPVATTADEVVDLCVQMREQVDPKTGRPRYSLGQLALRFKVPKSTVQSWCDGRRRGQAPARVKASG